MNMHVTQKSVRPKSKRTKPSVPCNRWTENDDLILREGLEQGLSHISIARKLGRSESAIKTRAYQRGLCMPEGKGRPRNWKRIYGAEKTSQSEKLHQHQDRILELAKQNPAQNKPIPFNELENKQCRFVVDDSSGMTMNCCGAPVMGGDGDARKRTHCAFHYKASIGVR